MNTHFWQSPLIVSCFLWAATTLATPVEVSIVGEGRVSVKETEDVCEQDCTIDNALSTNTFIPQAASEWEFSHWSGASCDAGNGMLYANEGFALSAGSNGAKTLLSGDFDGDGDFDFFNIALFDGTVNQLNNQGAGNFTSNQVLNGLQYPTALADYDWDADGDLDVLVIEYNMQRIVILENDGNGQFSEGDSIWLQGISPYALTIQDVNDDGFPDLLVASFEADTSGNLGQLVSSIRNPAITWYHNDGTDNFTPGEQLATTAAITLDSEIDTVSGEITIVAAEIIGGDSDGEGIVLYQGQQRTVIESSSSAYGVAVSDIDGNGTLDVLAAHYVPSKLNVIFQEGEGNFVTSGAVGTPSEGVTAAAIVDIDGDGLQDIATGQFNNDLFYYHRAKSYQECLVNNNHQLSITANFVAQSNSDGSDNEAPVATPTPTAHSSPSSSGGGAVGAVLLWLALICLIRRQIRVKSIPFWLPGR